MMNNNQEVIKIGWWYPVLKTEQDFELLPEAWRRNTNYRAFPMHRSVMLENIEALIEQQGEKEGEPYVLTTVRATPSFMRKVIEKRWSEFNIKSLQEAANAMVRLSCFDSSRIFDVEDIDSLPPIEPPSDDDEEPDILQQFSIDPALLNGSVNKMLAIFYTIVSNAVEGGLPPDQATDLSRLIVHYLCDHDSEQEVAERILQAVKYICDYRSDKAD